ncbi:MAG: EVE domain-containing protein [Chloroflexi bacterium]|nr:EVE domain-containing protein [Chloroflexota bacterium]
MAYYIDLFSPETYETFSKSDRSVSGFRPRQVNAASRIQVGDKLICYMVKLSRWVGVLEVTSVYYQDASPLFYSSNDPYTIRFKVKPLVWLPKEKSIPIHEDKVWNALSFTKGADKKSPAWTGKIRSSLNALDEHDGHFLEELITSQARGTEVFEVDEHEYAKLLRHKVRRPEGEVTVSIPQDTEKEAGAIPRSEARESIKVQALIAKIGAQMGLHIWLPRNDRSGVLTEWKSDGAALLENLPLNYDETTIKTIEQIDVLWLRGRAIVRAFEVEHTTSIYSGILRMADLLALQPNMNIKLHIVAPYARRDKVFQEIQRPVFSLLDEAPLSERCTFLSYDSIQEIAGLKHIEYLSDSVLDEYAEEAE